MFFLLELAPTINGFPNQKTLVQVRTQCSTC